MFIFKIIGYFILFIFFVLFIFVILPIEYIFEASKYDNTTFGGKIYLFKKFLAIDFSISDLSTSKIVIRILGANIYIKDEKIKIKNKDFKEKENEDKNKKLVTKNKEKNKSTNKNSSIVKNQVYYPIENINKYTISVLVNFIKKIFNHIKPSKLIIKASYGFDDPYYTGILLVILTSLYPFLKNYHINLQPNFQGTFLKGELKIQGRIVIVYLLVATLRLILSKPMVNIIKSLIRKKKEAKVYGS